MTINESSAASTWTIADIRNETDNWNLGSDVQMLHFLETFSDNLLSKINKTSRALEELVCFTDVGFSKR